jgi:hypothetical protein
MVPDTRPPKFPQVANPRQRAVLAAYARSGQVRAACAHAEVERSMHYHWLKHDAAYHAAFADAQQMVGDWLEEVAVRRATEGASPSDVLLIFLLKAAKPAKYRESHRREDQSDISELLKAVLLELADRTQARNVTPAPQAAWAPLPPGERRTPSPRPPLPAPPGLDEDVDVLP